MSLQWESFLKLRWLRVCDLVVSSVIIADPLRLIVANALR
jgi:hypothetical protein